MLESFLDWLCDMFFVKTPAALLTMIGAIAHYLYEIQMGHRSFTLLRFILTCVLGMYVGMLLGEFLPDDLKYRDGWLSLSGFAMYQIYFVLDTKVGPLFRKLVDNFLKGTKM